MLKDRISCDYSRYLEMDIVVLILCFTIGNTENRVVEYLVTRRIKYLLLICYLLMINKCCSDSHMTN